MKIIFFFWANKLLVIPYLPCLGIIWYIVTMPSNVIVKTVTMMIKLKVLLSRWFYCISTSFRFNAMSTEKRQIANDKYKILPKLDKQHKVCFWHYTFLFQRLFCSDAKGCQMTSSIMPLLVTPSTTPSSQITMASAQSHISTTSAATPPSHLAILSIKGFVLPSDNYSDISRQALSSYSPRKILYFIFNDTKQIVGLGYILAIIPFPTFRFWTLQRFWWRCSLQWLES